MLQIFLHIEAVFEDGKNAKFNLLSDICNVVLKNDFGFVSGFGS